MFDLALEGVALNILTLSFLVLMVGVLLVRGLARPGGILEYPFLAAATMAGWFVPQAILLMDDPSLPEFGYDLTMGMAALSMFAVLSGDRYGARRSRLERREFDESRLLVGAALLSGVGATAFALLLRTPMELTDDGTATGIVTVYFFFFTAQFFGLALSLNVFLKRYSPLAFAIVCFDYITMSGFVLFGGRRGPLAEIILITLCSLWFQRRILPPRALVIAGIVCGALFVNAAGEYRSLVYQINDNRPDGQAARLPTVDEILNIDFIGLYTSNNNRRTDEVRNAIYYISAVTDTQRFRFGLDYWNYFVFRYVPAQFLGRDFKDALMAPLPDLATEYYGYARWHGTTYTGFADAYLSFSFLGAYVYWLIAAAFSNYREQAIPGSIVAPYFYCILITTGIQGITHSTAWFIVFILQAYLFSSIVFRLSVKGEGGLRQVSSQSKNDFNIRR